MFACIFQEMYPLFDFNLHLWYIIKDSLVTEEDRNFTTSRTFHLVKVHKPTSQRKFFFLLCKGRIYINWYIKEMIKQGVYKSTIPIDCLKIKMLINLTLNLLIKRNKETIFYQFIN